MATHFHLFAVAASACPIQRLIRRKKSYSLLLY